MKIGIAAHNNGYKLKEELKKYLLTLSIEIEDFGTDSLEALKPGYSPGADLAKWVISNNTIGIACCGSGVGISIATNRVKGARCAIAKNPAEAKHLRVNNDINVLALGTRNQTLEEAKAIIKEYINANKSSNPTSCSYK